MKRRTGVPSTKIGRKKQVPTPPAPEPPRTPEQEAAAIRELAREVNATMAALHAQMEITVSKAKLAQTLARTELIKTAQGLLGKEHTLAERGRPRTPPGAQNKNTGRVSCAVQRGQRSDRKETHRTQRTPTSPTRSRGLVWVLRPRQRRKLW
jgi:hypothetical protein